MRTPTESQLAALRSYAAKHGRHWKAMLLHDWLKGVSDSRLELSALQASGDRTPDVVQEECEGVEIV